MDKAERKAKLRRARYERTEKAKVRKATYENTKQDVREVYRVSTARLASSRKYEATTGKDTRKEARATAYRDRKVIAIDGEGVTVRGRHNYILLAASTGASLYDPKGISSQAALNFLVKLAADNPGALFVSFGFGYDINKILKDLRPAQLKHLRKKEYLLTGDWRIWWRPGKYFGVGHMADLTIWDLRSFFRGNFINACVQVLGDDVPEIITSGKASRGNFKLSEIETIKEYNATELELMVTLAETIRHKLDDLGIRLNRFDGSGAIASAILKAHQVKEHLPPLDPEIERLAGNAFIGGRIECLQYGHSSRGGYQYDMRSAYPWAMTQLPSFVGTWTKYKGDPGQLPYAMYLIEWSGYDNPALPAPLPYRTKSGSIVYPAQGKALIWSPEIELIRSLSKDKLNYKILETWAFEPFNPDTRPFKFMETLYTKRKYLWEIGEHGAANILKLGLNSIWGKTAQRVGWSENNLPTYHNLVIAGLTTSYVRAAVYKAAMADLDAVVAIETDALITRRRLKSSDLKQGNELGEWVETQFKTLTYCNSGLAFATDLDGRTITRTSGVPTGVLNQEMILEAARAGARTLQVDRPLFLGVAECERLKAWDRFGEWDTHKENVSLRPTGKRLPLPKGKAEWTGWNNTVCPVLPKEISKSYEVPWQLNGKELAEYLLQEYEAMAVLDQGKK